MINTGKCVQVCYSKSNINQLEIKIAKMCISRKYPYSLNRSDWKFFGGGGISKTQKFKPCTGMKLNWDFQGDGGSWSKVLPWEGVWIFSGTIQS